MGYGSERDWSCGLLSVMAKKERPHPQKSLIGHLLGTYDWAID
jgi:hypothetical protein